MSALNPYLIRSHTIPFVSIREHNNRLKSVDLLLDLFLFGSKQLGFESYFAHTIILQDDSLICKFITFWNNYSIVILY